MFESKSRKNKYATVSCDWAFSHAKMDTSLFLCKKLKIFNGKLIREIKQKLKFF